MAVYILDNSEELGEKAADLIAKKLNEAIEKRGQARIILSTGASQFETIKYLMSIWNCLRPTRQVSGAT